MAAIVPNSLANGPGLRNVYFSQGCSHQCKNCFNQSTWSFEGGRMCNIKEIIETLKKQVGYLDGVTFSGGDPFEQPEAFAELAKAIHAMGVNIWAYTGYTFDELLEMGRHKPAVKVMLENIDVVVDGPYIESQMDEHIMYRGSKNQRIVDVPSSLRENKVIVLNYDDMGMIK